jgi:UrcA family protein
MNASLKNLAVAALACGMVMGAAVAQDVPEIQVLGTRTTVKVKPATDSPTPLYKTLQLSYAVDAADLDLRTDSGAAALEKRVNDAALALCQEIGRQYPNSEPDDATCAKQAFKKAMVEVRALTAEARKKAV